MSSTQVAEIGDLSIWDLYKKANLAKPQNVSQLMKWSKQTDNVRSLRFFEAKKIFKLRSQNDDTTDMAQEKIELQEWIGDCKEEIMSLRSNELQNEDDFEESMEEIDIKFGHLMNKLLETKQQLISKRKLRYNKVQKSIKTQKELLQQTLGTLTKTLRECDMKRDKKEVDRVLSSVPEFTEIEYNKHEINLLPLKKELTKLSREGSVKGHGNGHSSGQLLEFKDFNDYKNADYEEGDEDEDEDEEDENENNQINEQTEDEDHDEKHHHILHGHGHNGHLNGHHHHHHTINEEVEDDAKEYNVTPTLLSTTPTLEASTSSNFMMMNGLPAAKLESYSSSNLSIDFTPNLKIRLSNKESADIFHSNPTTPITPNTQKKKKKKKKKRMKRKDFKFISVIGRGTFGKIVLVKKKDDGSKYAMKVLKKQQIIALQQEDNINTEIKVLKHVQHPFLLRAHYVFQTESKIYLVLDYYRYGDLMSHLKAKSKFNETEARHILSEVALSIGCLHSGGIVYRDLKPENLLMDAKGHICLCDFGLCKKVGLGTMSTFCGTPDYLAPEILNREAYDKNVDWWSFGILAFELVAGIVPFYSTSNMQMYEKIKTQKLMFPSYVKEVCRDLIRKLLNRTPKLRLGAVDDVNDIRKHVWFEEIDWMKILNKESEPPYRPGIGGDDEDEVDYDKDVTNNMEMTPTPTPNPEKGLLANYAV